MPTNKKKSPIFIGVAWPYVNGDLHVGHLAGYLLPADITARYFRAKGNEVLMASGSDCFGTPITVEADKKGVSPREIVDIYHAKDVNLFKNILGLTYDIYTKTDSDQHVKITQDFFLTLLKNGYVFIDKTKQYFSREENRFLPDRYVEGICKYCGFAEARSDQCDSCGRILDQGDLDNPKSKLSGKKVELKDTEHYFLDWPKLQPQVEKFVKKSGPNWKNWVYKETLGWLTKGIKPRAITRDIDWGVPIPTDKIPENLRLKNSEHKRIYVWFDAVIGYYSASLLWAKESGNDWKKFWINEDSKHYYFMGKDNLVFHTIFWPGQLIGYNPKLHLPDIEGINMFLNLEGKQFSKSRGVSIAIEDIVNQYGNDPVRFYLTLIMPEIKDSSFSMNEFINKNNEILVANLGNFIHRVLSLAQGVDISEVSGTKLLKETEEEIEKAFNKSGKFIEGCEFKNYLDTILALSGYGNKYLDYQKIWVLKKSDTSKYHEVLKQLYLIIIALGYLSKPLFPDSSRKIFDMLGLNERKLWPSANKIIIQINALLATIDTSIKPEPLFKKLDLPLQK